MLAGELRQLLRTSPEVVEFVPIERLNLLVDSTGIRFRGEARAACLSRDC